MYCNLLSALKRRLVFELKDSFSRHPLYNKVTPFIQAKYAFAERPQFGIVVKGAGANRVQLSADNFIGVVQSHVMLAYLGQPSYPIEWVREDAATVQNHKGHFPTPPGIYYIEVLTAPTNPEQVGTFVIDPLITVSDEPVLQFSSGIEREAQLQNPPAPGTLELWESKQYKLIEHKEYTVDYASGKISFTSRFLPRQVITADYRHAAPSIGPVPYQWNHADFKTLPGVVLAFGKRAQKGDKVAVLVYPERIDAAMAYGGRFEVSFDLDVIATDPVQMEDIADYALMSLWGEKKPMLEREGIAILDLSMGGESEETYDETADTFYYMISLSIQLQADWESHIPLPVTISKVTPVSADAEGTLTLDRRVGVPDSLVSGAPCSLFFATHPVIVGRGPDYERIG